MLNFLQDTSKQLHDMQERRAEDRLDHLAKFVASEVQAKPQALHDTYIKEITNVLFRDFTIELECD